MCNTHHKVAMLYGSGDKCGPVEKYRNMPTTWRQLGGAGDCP